MERQAGERQSSGMEPRLQYAVAPAAAGFQGGIMMQSPGFASAVSAVVAPAMAPPPPSAAAAAAAGYSHIQQQQLHHFWTSQMLEIQHLSEFKAHHQLPLARIKKIMKADEDVRMIAAEAPVLFAKACEMFILELTLRSWMNTEENKRRTLQKNDISAAVARTDMFDFLVDIVPRDELREEGFVAMARQAPQPPLISGLSSVAASADAMAYRGGMYYVAGQSPRSSAEDAAPPVLMPLSSSASAVAHGSAGPTSIIYRHGFPPPGRLQAWQPPQP